MMMEGTTDDAREFEELCDTWAHLRPTVIKQVGGSHQDPVGDAAAGATGTSRCARVP